MHYYVFASFVKLVFQETMFRFSLGLVSQQNDKWLFEIVSRALHKNLTSLTSISP